MAVRYSDLINVPSFGKKRESTFNLDRGNISFWCKDCKKMITPIKLLPQTIHKQTKEYLYKCEECGNKNIAIGTEEGLRGHYEKRF